MFPGNRDGELQKGIQLKLDQFMEKVFWKDILMEITSMMDPWDIDLVELANGYSKKVEMMKELNFKIPANVILVSSILLRMKSDLLVFSGPDWEYDLENWVKEGTFLEEFSQFQPEEGDGKITSVEIESEIPIQVRPKRVTKRRITALELITALSEVLEEKERERIKEGRKGEEIIVLNKFDIEKSINETYRRVMEILMRGEEVLFSELVKGRGGLIHTLISLLHLSSNKKLKLEQLELYGEIFIRPFS
jgi:segregation and condensation protein A